MERQVLTPAMLRCLASPARTRVYEALRSLGEASAREVAEELRRPPAGVHYHLAELAHVDLIREAYRRPGVKKPEAVYRPTGKEIVLPDTADPAIVELRKRAVLARLRETEREYDRLSGEATEGLRNGTHFLQIAARLNERDLAEFKSMLEAAAEFAKQRDQKGGTSIRWQSVALPERKRKA